MMINEAKIFNPAIYLFIEGDFTDRHYYWSYFNLIVSPCLSSLLYYLSFLYFLFAVS